MWEVRQKWDLDRVKAKASCQDRVKVGRRRRSGIREGARVWTGARVAEPALGQGETLPAGGNG